MGHGGNLGCHLGSIHVISPYFGGSSLYFAHFLRKSPYENFQNFLYILYISLFGISDLPTKNPEFPSLFNHSPYLEKKISLFVFWDVSHVCLAVILAIILVTILSAICIIHPVVYLCYKLIYGRVKIYQKSLSHISENVSYLTEYPTHFKAITN